MPARRPARAARTVLAALLAGSLPASCGNVPTAHSVRTHWPHKDLVVISVEVGSRLDADAYRELAARQIEAILDRPPPAGAPLYEVRVEFYLPPGEAPLRHPVARVSYVAGSGAGERGGRFATHVPPRVTIF